MCDCMHLMHLKDILLLYGLIKMSAKHTMCNASRIDFVRIKNITQILYIYIM